MAIIMVPSMAIVMVVIIDAFDKIRPLKLTILFYAALSGVGRAGETMTPRPKKPRNCSCPASHGEQLIYKPTGTPLHALEKVRLEHDELDALYLCDGQGLTQEQAGQQLGVSRGTVQRLVNGGRRKLITALANGQALIVCMETTSEL